MNKNLRKNTKIFTWPKKMKIEFLLNQMNDHLFDVKLINVKKKIFDLLNHLWIFTQLSYAWILLFFWMKIESFFSFFYSHLTQILPTSYKTYIFFSSSSSSHHHRKLIKKFKESSKEMPQNASCCLHEKSPKMSCKLWVSKWLDLEEKYKISQFFEPFT
jgi:hypothetical protein